MDDTDADQVKALPCLLYDALKAALRHGWVVFQREGANALPFIDIAHGSDKTGDCTNGWLMQAKCDNFRADIEIVQLNADSIGRDDRRCVTHGITHR